MNWRIRTGNPLRKFYAWADIVALVKGLVWLEVWGEQVMKLETGWTQHCNWLKVGDQGKIPLIRPSLSWCGQTEKYMWRLWAEVIDRQRCHQVVGEAKKPTEVELT